MPRARIRAALVDGTLPPVDGRAWAGKGFGQLRCACCGSTIALGAPKFETQAPAGLHAHAGCFTVWVEESRALKPPGAAAIT